MGFTDYNLNAIEFKKLRTCVFDYDGVIIDSEYIHSEAKKITLDYLKITYNHDILEKFKGYPDNAFFEYVKKYLVNGNPSIESMVYLKNSLYKVLFKKIGLVEGVLDFINWSKNHFNYIALVSSANKQDINLGLEKFELASCFNTIISGNDTIKCKPNPEPYILMTQQLNISPEEALVIEDSPSGVLAAKNAGCPVFAITTSFSKEELFKAGADFIVNNFDEIKKTISNEQFKLTQS